LEGDKITFFYSVQIEKVLNSPSTKIWILNLPCFRWVELDRPLKKQLDKYAQDPYLYLGVMFYVNDVSLLEDEVTR
jgi:hypothetical protein